MLWRQQYTTSTPRFAAQIHPLNNKRRVAPWMTAMTLRPESDKQLPCIVVLP